MTEFEDSTGLISDIDALRLRMQRDGYLLLRGVLAVERVNELQLQILSILAEEGWLMDSQDVLERIANPAACCYSPQPEFRRVAQRIYRLEAFHAIPHQTAILELFREFFGTAPLPHPNSIARVVFPSIVGNPLATTPRHQDYRTFQGSVETYTAWIPLHRCEAEDGPLAVAPGTHDSGLLPVAGEVRETFDGNWKSGTFDPGDLLLLHSHVVHKALPNHSKRIRLSIDARYQPLNEPICDVFVSDRSYWSGMDWTEIYADFKSKDLQFYWKGLPLQAIPYDPAFYAEQERIAFTQGEAGDTRAKYVLSLLALSCGDATKKRRAAELVALLDRQENACSIAD